MMLLAGKKIIVTGGVTGCGKATAIEAAKEGASVVTMSRAKDTDERAVKTIEECKRVGTGGVFKHIRCDISNREDVFKAFAEAVDFMGGGLDGMVNSGGLDASCPSHLVEGDELHRIFNVNIDGTIFTNQAAYSYMVKQDKGGSIYNFASISGVTGIDNNPAYSASKGAVIAWTRLVAREWGKYNIRVNMQALACKTEMSDEWWYGATPEVRAGYGAWLDQVIPLGKGQGYEKLQPAAESAYLVCFFLSDKATFLTGQFNGVDGGMFMGR
jgi:3-oxoacyl-[acyl-carrier protein] reductase